MLTNFVLLMLNTDIELKNDDFENTMDNGTQNEHQISLPIPNNEKENEFQNASPVSSSHLYIQSSIVPEISKPQTTQPPSQSQDNTEKSNANISRPNPTLFCIVPNVLENLLHI